MYLSTLTLIMKFMELFSVALSSMNMCVLSSKEQRKASYFRAILFLNFIELCKKLHPVEGLVL